MIRASRALIFRLLAVVVTANALAGILTLTGSGSLGETEEDILFSVLTLSLASILLLGPIAAWERVSAAGIPMLPAISASGTCLAAIMLLGGIWFEPTDDEVFGKLLLTFGLVGIGCAHVCLLMLAKADGLRMAAIIVSAALGLQLGLAIWGVGPDGDAEWRLIGITLILVLALSVLLPARSWAAGSRPAPASKVRYCPFCGTQAEFGPGVMVCSRCNTRFEVSKAGSEVSS